MEEKATVGTSSSSTPSSVSSSTIINSNTSANPMLWKAVSIFITFDVILWMIVRRYSNVPKKKTKRFQQEFSSWSRMAYEQQTKTNYSSSKTSSEARNKTKHFKYQSTRVIDRHLDVLGIPKIIGVLPKEVEIKDAYRKICLKTHPDVLGSNHPGRQEAEKKFIEATNSYNFLLKDSSQIPKTIVAETVTEPKRNYGVYCSDSIGQLNGRVTQKKILYLQIHRHLAK